MKKSLKKLNLSRETLRTLEGSNLNQVGGNGRPVSPIPNTQVTSCDYTYSCPELCGPIASRDITCLCP